MTTSAPEVFSSVINLGGLQKVYPGKKSGRWGNLIGTLFFLGVAAAAWLYSLWMMYTLWQRGTVVLQRNFGDDILPPFLIGSFFFLVGILLAWSAFSNWKKSAALYRDGFAYVDRKGVKSWNFEQVTGMTAAVTKHYRNGIYTGTTHVYTLWNKAGDRMNINDAIQGVEELASGIRKGIYPHLYQAAANAYNAGKPVQFGAVTISKANGLQMKKKAYPWNEVKEVKIQKGILKVAKKGGGWFSGTNIAVSTIPNLDVLLSMIDQIVGLKSG